MSIIDKIVSFFKKDTTAFSYQTKPADDTALLVVDAELRGDNNADTRAIYKRIKSRMRDFNKSGVAVFKTDDPQQDLLPALKAQKKTSLLLCGFNLNARVCDIALKAQAQGFNVSVINDLTGNDQTQRQSDVTGVVAQLKEKGVQIRESSHVLHSRDGSARKLLK
jgi:hypothetical protein